MWRSVGYLTKGALIISEDPARSPLSELAQIQNGIARLEARGRQKRNL